MLNRERKNKIMRNRKLTAIIGGVALVTSLALVGCSAEVEAEPRVKGFTDLYKSELDDKLDVLWNKYRESSKDSTYTTNLNMQLLLEMQVIQNQIENENE